MLLCASAALAQTFTYDVLFDLDRDPATGCDSSAPGGTLIPGIERRLRATVDAATATVEAVTLASCADTAFAPPVTLGGPYPVGLDNGLGVIEAAVSLAELDPDQAAVGLAFGAADATGSDVLTGDGEAILFGLSSGTIGIPTLSAWGLALFALVLMIGLWRHHRRTGRGVGLVMLVLAASAVLAANFVADGDISDWAGEAPRATDPAGDATNGGTGNDLREVFVGLENGVLFFRIDVTGFGTQAPVAVDDTYTTAEDTVLNVAAPGVLANDSDPDSDPITAVLDTGPSNAASFVLNPDGSFGYTPAIDFNGTDSFTYVADDGTDQSAPATVTLTVTAVNDPPEAVDDTVTTDEDTPLTFDPRVNDSDPDGDPLTITGVTPGASGSVTINAGIEVTYTPNPDFNGADTFTYTIDDGNGGTDTTTVSVIVAPVNDPPDAVDDTAATDEDTPVTFDPRANDSDPEGDPLTITAVTPGANGSVTINAGVEVTYTPAVNFNGTDTFTYTIEDGNGGTDTATVTVTVAAVNDAPLAVDDLLADILETSGAVTLDVLVNDSDVDGDALAITATGATQCGTVVNNGTDLTYIPNDVVADCAESFTYTIGDGSGGGDTATVGFTVVQANEAPTAVDDAVATNEDTPVTFDPRGNDTDGDGDAFNITEVSTPTSGSAVNNGGASITYTPAVNFNGTDSFTYTIDDGNGGTDTATVTVTVTNVNDSPVAIDDAGTTDEDTLIVLSVLANDTDPDIPTPGDTLSIVTVSDGALGTTTITGTGTTITYTPGAAAQALAAGEILNDSFTYAVEDGAGLPSNMATVTITILGVNDAPVATNETFDALGNTALEVSAAASISPALFVSGSVIANDTDPDTSDTLTATPVVSGASTNGGVFNLAADGTFDYTPPPGVTGSDTFDYEVVDGNGGSDTGTVTVNITDRIWYVDNTAPAGGNGTSTSRFNTLAAAETAAAAGDTIYVFEGDSTDTGQDAGITLQDNQRLVGADVALTTGGTFNGVVDQELLAAGNRPLISHTATGVTAENVSVEILGLTLIGTPGVAVTKDDGGAVTVVVEDNEIIGTDTGFSALTDGGAGTLELAFNRNTGLSGAGAAAVDIDGSAGGALYITAFADNTVGGAAAGAGLAVNAAVFDADPADADFTGDQVSAGVTVIGDAVGPDPIGGSGIVLTNVSGDLAFSELTVNATGAGLQASGTGPINAGAGTGLRITTPATTAVTTTGGPALSLAAAEAAVTLSTISTTSSATTGVSLTNVDGTVAIPGGAITNPTGTAFNVSGGNAAINYGGTVTNTTGRAASITNRTGGAVTLSGSINDTGAGILVQNNTGGTVTFSNASKTINTGTNAAVQLLSNTGATITFTGGGLDIDTTSGAGFTATGGGTVAVTGAGNTIDNTTGSALDVSNTDIGADGLTFESISSNGGSNPGILLDSTGAAGGLTVTGTGGDCTAITPTCSGGRIQATTGANGAVAGNGIYLENTRSVSLTRMRIGGHQNHAIFGDTVTGFTLADSLIDGANGDDAGGDEGSVRFVNLLGSGAITRTDISGGLEDNLRLVNSTGTLDRLVITDTIFRDNSTSFGNDGILMEANGTAVVNVTVDNSDFSAHRGDHFDAAATDDATLDLVFTNNNMSGGPSPSLGQSFILSNAQSSEVTFDVSGNSINGSIVTAFIFFQSAMSTAASSIIGTFSGNTIGTAGVAGSGSQGNGVTFNAAGDGTMTALADGNTIRQWSAEYGMLVQAGDGSPVLDVTATNNLITEPNNTADPINGLHLNAGTTSAGTAQVCLDARNNDILNSGGTAFNDDDFRLRQRNSSTVSLPGYAGAASDTAEVVTFVQGNNIGTPTGSALVSGSGGGFTGGAACVTP